MTISRAKSFLGPKQRNSSSSDCSGERRSDRANHKRSPAYSYRPAGCKTDLSNFRLESLAHLACEFSRFYLGLA